MRKLLINGRPDDMLSALDRGLQFGDGLFETLAVIDGRPSLWNAHLMRLQVGCERLAIPMPPPDLLRHEAQELSTGRARAVLKIILTRGCGGRGYRVPETPEPNRVMLLSDWPAYPDEWQNNGVAVTHCQTRLGLNPQLAGIKHLNRLEQVLARSEWQDLSIAEGLLQDVHGRVIEGTASNLFVQYEGRLSTPRLDMSGVAGVMRGLVMKLAEVQGQPVIEQDIHADDLATAEALYLTNSLIGVWPVSDLAGQAYASAEKPHPVMAAAMEAAYGP